jgi:hypothetical protein
MSLRQLIIDRLNEQQIFTDQNFLGSNLATVIDIISYAYHTLIYYLNKTSSESMFSEAQLYENVNRIVKLIDYSPIGFQTSTLAFNCSASNLTPGVLYTIPRYTYISVNSIPFSFNEEVTFLKTIEGTESLAELAQQKLLFQGLYQEYPVQTATGEDNEIILLNPGNDLVDHFSIDVFVKPIKTDRWEQFTKTSNLLLENGIAKKYEIRLNGSKRYEIKFGDDVNGVKLQTGDQVAVYYLASLGSTGQVEAGALNLATPILYNTIQYNQILADIFQNDYLFLNSQEINSLLFSNTNSSSTAKNAETPDEIRRSAAYNFRSQYRLVTTNDYETFVKTNFTNLVTDVKSVNNWQYVSTYLKYFYDIGLTDPSKTERALLNQVMYADACNFNNIYLFVVPRANSSTLSYLLPAQKELINTTLLPIKTATAETVFADPVYKAIDIGILNSQLTGEYDPFNETSLTQLEVIKQASSRRDNQSIINDIVNVIAAYFDRGVTRLGQTVDLRLLTQQILNIEGIETFYTKRTDDPTVKLEGLSIFCWNPAYPLLDKTVTTNNIPLRYFEYPYFNALNNLSSKIKIVSISNSFETTEY